MYTLTGPLWRPTIWPMSKSINRLCLVFKNVSTSHQSIASASSSSAPPPLNDVKRKYSAEIDQLSASITEFCSESFERNRELNARIRPIVADIERVVCASGGHSRLVLTGSIASGMAFDASADLNLVIFDAGQRKIFMNDFSATSDAFVQILVMEAIAETLKKFYDASSGDRMPRLASIASSTRTPVVFGRLDDGLEFNIRFPWADAQRIRNTLMVRYYAQADRRFLLLFHWLRRVFQQMGLSGRKQLFSSYHTLLLVLHFLNRKEVPDNVLPAFVDFPAEMRDQMYAPDVANIVQKLDEPPLSERLPFWTSKCAKSVGELAVELVDYYALFDPRTTAISIEHGRTDKKSASLRDRPFLCVYDPFCTRTATRSNLHDKALVLAFQFLRGQMSDGKHLATFPLLDGLAEKFAAHTRDRGIRGGRDILRANNLKQGGGKILRDMKNVEFEQSSEEQGEREIKDGGFKQLPEEQEEWEMKDGGFQQLPEEQEEWEMKDGGFQQLPEEQGEREMKDGGFEQLLRNMRTKKRREMKDGGFEQLPEEQGEREMKDGRFEQLPEEQGEREMKDGGFEQSSEEQGEREMKDGGFEQSSEEQGERQMKDVGFEQLPEEQRERKMKNVGFEQSSEEQEEREMKDGRFEQLPEEQGEREMKDGGFEQSSEEQGEWQMKDVGFEQLPDEQGERKMKDGRFEQLLRNMKTKRRREMKGGGVT